MKIAIIDPGCSAVAGHNLALLEEFSRELRSRGVEVHAVLTRDATTAAIEPFGTHVVRALQIGGYVRLEDVFARFGSQEACVSALALDLAQLDLSSFDAVLLPTIYPLHLLALERAIASLSKTAVAPRVALGFLMPVSYWTKDAALRTEIGVRMREALFSLRARCEVLAWTETGRYDFGDAVLELPRLYPVVSAELGDRMQALAAIEPASLEGRPVTFGFFGAPLRSKGIEVLVDAVARARMQPGFDARVKLVVPKGMEGMRETLSPLGPQLMVFSKERGNREYLEEMASVDVVLLPYEPGEYSEKFSGIVVEAIALGKAVVVTDACTPLVRFLDDVAPGSYAAIDYDASALASALTLPSLQWAPLVAAARASSGIARSLKSAERLFAALGLQLPPPTDRASQASPAHTVTPSAAVTVSSDAAPVVSIVIPTFNRQHLIEETIESARAQTFRELEIVVVDNASEDGTAKVVERIARRDPRVRLHRNPTNVGPVRNWMRGLELARAPYGKLLFSDDLLHPTFIERLLPALIDPKTAFAIGATVIGDKPWKGRTCFRLFEDPTRVTRSVYEAISLGSIHALPVSPGAGLFRTADLRASLRLELPGVRDYDFAETGAGVDWMVYLLTLLRYERAFVHPDTLAFFRSHSGSITIENRGGRVMRGYELASAWFNATYRA